MPGTAPGRESQGRTRQTQPRPQEASVPKGGGVSNQVDKRIDPGEGLGHGHHSEEDDSGVGGAGVKGLFQRSQRQAPGCILRASCKPVGLGMRARFKSRT